MGRISSSNQELVTKGFLKTEFKKHTQLFERKLDKPEYRVEKVELKFDELEKKFDRYRDEIMTMLDRIMCELITIRQEQEIFNARFIKNDEILERHEMQISNLGKTTQIHHLN